MDKQVVKLCEAIRRQQVEIRGNANRQMIRFRHCIRVFVEPNNRVVLKTCQTNNNYGPADPYRVVRNNYCRSLWRLRTLGVGEEAEVEKGRK